MEMSATANSEQGVYIRCVATTKIMDAVSQDLKHMHCKSTFFQQTWSEHH